MTWVLEIVGFLLIVVAMRDLGRTLFHPSEHGNVTDFLTLGIWRAIRRAMPRRISSAGALNFFVVILYWGLSVVVGFTLIYAPLVAQRFSVPNVSASQVAVRRFAYAGAISLANLITVSTGAQTGSLPMQYAMGLEAVLGFVILTASISWILSIYSVIEHRRSLAHEVTLLHFLEDRGLRRLEQMNDNELQTLLFAKIEQVITIRTELSQFPITYFFQENDSRSAIAPALYYLVELAEDLSREKPDVLTAATVLGGALDDLLELMTTKFLGRSFRNRYEALDAIVDDHMRTPLHRPGREISTDER